MVHYSYVPVVVRLKSFLKPNSSGRKKENKTGGSTKQTEHSTSYILLFRSFYNLLYSFILGCSLLKGKRKSRWRWFRISSAVEEVSSHASQARERSPQIKIVLTVLHVVSWGPDANVQVFEGLNGTRQTGVVCLRTLPSSVLGQRSKVDSARTVWQDFL